jgi:membrane fusion protein (multidrug efflux system)
MRYNTPISLVIALIVALLPISAYAQRGPASVFVETVSERQFSRDIEALGTLSPNEQVQLTLNASDRITAIYFDDGERVRQGKTLLSLAQREQVALVEAAEANVEEANLQLERIERLAKAEAVSKSELDRARRDLDSARANLRALQSRQRDRILVAPFDGILGFRQVSVGSFVSPGTVVATLIDDNEMNLDFDVPSTFLRSILPGTEVIAETDDLPGEVFRGSVATLDNRIDPITRSVRARASLANPDRLLKSGMFMRVKITASPRRGLAVPEEAVQPVGPQTFVWLAIPEGDQILARRVEVQLGQRDSGYIEVLSGLSADDQVITEGIIRIREGAAVTILDKSVLQPSTPSSNPAGIGPTASGIN